MAPAVHENYRPRALHGCEWHEALNAHAMNSVLRLIHAKPRLLMSIFQSAFRGRSSHSPQPSTAQAMILALCSVTKLLSCYKDPAELVLFHDVEMKWHIMFVEFVRSRRLCGVPLPHPLAGRGLARGWCA